MADFDRIAQNVLHIEDLRGGDFVLETEFYPVFLYFGTIHHRKWPSISNDTRCNKDISY